MNLQQNSLIDLDNYNGRFKSAPWYTSHPSILIGGLGGIGSNTLYCLAKSVPGKYFLVDNDTIDDHNIGTQFFNKDDVGKFKVESLSATISKFSSRCELIPVKSKIDIYSYRPISIAAFDNMPARKLLFNVWRNHEDRELFIEGRLRATMYEIYIVVPGREEEYEKTLFEDGEAEKDLCTFKQTAYFGMMIGARITQMVVNYLTNKSFGEEINKLPFCIKEMGEMVYMDVK